MIEHTSLDDWQSNFKASVDSVFIATKAAFKAMYQQGSGAVVTVSSVSSLQAEWQPVPIRHLRPYQSIH